MTDHLKRHDMFITVIIEGKRKRGKLRTTYIDELKEKANLEIMV